MSTGEERRSGGCYVGNVGTLPRHQGNGLATALLGHALHAYRDAGYDEASLAADSATPTAALGVYRRLGFALESRWTNYVMTVDAQVGEAQSTWIRVVTSGPIPRSSRSPKADSLMGHAGHVRS